MAMEDARNKPEHLQIQKIYEQQMKTDKVNRDVRWFQRKDHGL